MPAAGSISRDHRSRDIVARDPAKIDIYRPAFVEIETELLRRIIAEKPEEHVDGEPSRPELRRHGDR